MRTEIKKTRDGSSTLFVPELNEHYHSVNGAVQESRHVFLRMGLQAVEKDRLRILETGFGTGLNALLTYLAADNRIKIHYCTLEKYPLGWEKVSAMRYEEFLKLTSAEKEIFRKMHHCKWGQGVAVTEHFSLEKIETNFLDYRSEVPFDLVYFDAFAPDVQPELWTGEVFLQMHEMLLPGGILVTYCAKGEVRRRMVRAGFRVERLPGPPGKREMLRATRPGD
ncbi:MAG: tRNA (5-methylaminomethyl-2-thiouridine)(34)-methyltransferase MnmD [Bacteroidales bacterium]|nr:tRNA (5-methylaminomethyl-2-thiouridine)(34)-methyltransferase MnmD [Bacteroidales bacterium]